MKGNKPDPLRLEALRNLPREVLQSLTKEEIQAFVLSDEWPESLKKKLKDYTAESN